MSAKSRKPTVAPEIHFSDDEPQPGEIWEYLSGRPDYGAIERYIHLGPADKLARLAALLSSCNGQFNPAELVGAAAKLRDEAEKFILAERMRLASGMNRDTHDELARRLNVKNIEQLMGYRDGPEWQDPLLFPLLNRIAEASYMERFESSPDEFRHYFSVDDVGEAINIAESRTSLPAPEVLDKLDNALRWAANEEEAPAELLELAFMDLLTTLPLFTRTERFERSMAGIEIPDDGSAAENQSRDSTDTRGTKSLDCSTSIWAGVRAQAKQIEQFVREFRPGLKPPKTIKDNAEIAFLDHWADDQADGHFFINNEKRAWLAAKFHPFWKKHRPEYIRLANDARKERERVSAQNSKNAAKTASARLAREYLEYTCGFVDYLTSRRIKIPEDVDAKEQLIKNFVDENTELKGKASKQKVVDYLHTLHAHGNDSPADFVSKLKMSPIHRFHAMDNDKQEQWTKMKKITDREKRMLQKRALPKEMNIFRSFTVDVVQPSLDVWEKFSEGRAKKS